MVPGIVTIWLEPWPGSDMISLAWSWSRPGIREHAMPGLLMPPSDARKLMSQFLACPGATGTLDEVTILLE